MSRRWAGMGRDGPWLSARPLPGGNMGQLPHVLITRRTSSSEAVRQRAARDSGAADGHDHGRRNAMVNTGEHFAQALAAKDSAALCALLADPIDFQALTPSRH